MQTTIHALLEFQLGIRIALLASWDVWKHGIRRSRITARPPLRVPDPNFFGGTVEIAGGRDDGEATPTVGNFYGVPNYPAAKPIHANDRGLGLADMAAAIEAGRPHRANGDWAFHILDVMLAILRSAESERAVAVGSRGEHPAALGTTEADALLAQVPDALHSRARRSAPGPRATARSGL